MGWAWHTLDSKESFTAEQQSTSSVSPGPCFLIAFFASSFTGDMGEKNWENPSLFTTQHSLRLELFATLRSARRVHTILDISGRPFQHFKKGQFLRDHIFLKHTVFSKYKRNNLTTKPLNITGKQEGEVRSRKRLD